MLEITQMAQRDLPFTERMLNIEQWGNNSSDMTRLMDFEPEGCLIARLNRRAVGMVTTTSYGTYAFLGMLIVQRSSRGRGIGEKLMRAAIDYLQRKGVQTVELDAVFAAAPLYRRLGFKDKYLSLRVFHPAASGRATRLRRAGEYVDDIVALDRLATGFNRERVIRRLIEDYADSFCLIKNGKLHAYAVARPRASGFITFGPLLADSRNTATAILSGMLAKYKGRKIALGVPETNREAVELFSRKGFLHFSPSLRMYLGPRRNYEQNMYGIIAPEKG